MANYRTHILSTKPVAEIYDYVADFSHAAEWDPTVTSANRRGSGEVEVGETFSLVVQMGNREVPMTYEVIEAQAPSRIVLRAETKQLISQDTITVRSTPAGTILDYEAHLELRGWLRFADPLLSIAFKRIGDRAADGLREHVT